MAAYDLGTAHGRIEIDASTLGRTSAALATFGTAFLGVGVAAAAGFGIALKMAGDFEKAMSGVSAVLAVPTSELDKLRDKALQLGADTKFTATEVAQGFESMAKAGLQVDEILRGAADASVSLAAAVGDMDLDRAAEVMVNVMRTFNLEAEDTVRVADLLAGAANASTLEVEDLAVSLKYTGAVAAAMGLSLEETNTALAILGDRGIRGSTAGTSLRGVLLSLTGASGPAKEALRELGIITADGSNKFFDAQGNMKSMAEVAQILGDHTRHLSEEQRAAAFNTIFQRRAMASAIILADAGAEGFRKYADEINRVSAADVAAEKLNNLSGDIEILSGNFQTFVINFGRAFQDVARTVVQGATKVVEVLNRMDEDTLKLIGTIVAISAVFFTLLGTTLLVFSVFVKMYRATRDLINAFRLGIAVVKLLGTTMKAAALANPWTALALAVIALGTAIYALYRNFEPFRNLVDSTWQAIQRLWDWITQLAVALYQTLFGAVQAAVGAIQDFWQGLQDLAGTIAGAFSAAVDAVVNFFQELPGRLVEVIQNVIQMYIDFYTGLFDLVVEWVPRIVQGIIDFLAELPDRIAYILGFIIGRILRWYIDWWALVIEWVPRIVTGIIEFLSELPGQVWEILVDIVTSFAEWVADMLARALRFAADFVENIIRFFSELPGRAWDLFVDLLQRLGELERQAIAKAIEIGSGILRSIVDFLVQLPVQAFLAFMHLLSEIGNFVFGALSAASEVGRAIYNGLWNVIKDIPSMVGDIFRRAWDAVKGAVGSALSAGKSFGSSLWNGFKSGLGISSPSYIERAMWALTDNVGRSLVDFERQVADIQALGSNLNRFSPTVDFRLGQGAGVLSPTPAGALVGAGVGATPVGGFADTGDTFIINHAEQKTALEISREIIFQKQVVFN